MNRYFTKKDTQIPNKHMKRKLLEKYRLKSNGLMHDTGCLGLGHWDDPEGGYGEGGGFRMESTGIPVVDSFQCLAKLIQYCKV